jgi:hypothetical protein
MRNKRKEPRVSRRPRKRSTARNGQIRALARRTVSTDRPEVLTRTEHLQGLWVTLGLADVAD